jgi:hypothetical protein
MEQAQASIQVAQEPKVYVTLPNGNSVQALTIARVNAIIKGMIKNGKVLTGADNGKYVKGVKVIGDGNAFDGAIGLRYIYNVDLISDVAYNSNSPKKAQALAAIQEAKKTGDLLAMHNACREFLNAITVSFSVASAQFSNNQLIKAQVELVTTDNGSLLTLRNISAQEAETLKARPELKYDLSALVDSFDPTLLPTGETVAQAVSAENALS